MYDMASKGHDVLHDEAQRKIVRSLHYDLLRSGASPADNDTSRTPHGLPSGSSITTPWHDGVSAEQPSTASGTGPRAPPIMDAQSVLADPRLTRRFSQTGGAAETPLCTAASQTSPRRGGPSPPFHFRRVGGRSSIAISGLSWRSGRIDSTARPAILAGGHGQECQQHRRSATLMGEDHAKSDARIRIAYVPRVHTARRWRRGWGSRRACLL